MKRPYTYTSLYIVGAIHESPVTDKSKFEIERMVSSITELVETGCEKLGFIGEFNRCFKIASETTPVRYASTLFCDVGFPETSGVEFWGFARLRARLGSLSFVAAKPCKI